MKLKLYIDFDGVILNTIQIMEKMLIEQGMIGDVFSKTIKQDFFLNLDWEEVVSKSSPLQNSISNIKRLKDSNLYEIAILTHVNSSKEVKVKEDYLKQFFSDLLIIPVNYPTPKYQVVDCRNAILVDDYTKNLTLWEENGGISVKFSIAEKDNAYMTINDLGILIDKYEEFIKLINY